METRPVIKVIEMQCPPELEEGWNTWYNEKHVPQVLKFSPQIISMASPKL